MSDDDDDLTAIDIPMTVIDSLRAEIMCAIWGEQWIIVVPTGAVRCEHPEHHPLFISSHGLPRPRVREVLMDVTATLSRAAMDE
jgi:hypothetical protein